MESCSLSGQIATELRYGHDEFGGAHIAQTFQFVLPSFDARRAFPISDGLKTVGEKCVRDLVPDGKPGAGCRTVLVPDDLHLSLFVHPDEGSPVRVTAWPHF